MTPLVIDASVILKWFLEEVDTAIARALPQQGYQLVAPTSLPVEVANGLWNAQRRERIEPEDALSALTLLPGVKVILVDTAELLQHAFDVAVTHGRTVYDSLYVALAVREECQFVTADERLYNALRGSFPRSVVLLRDFATTAPGPAKPPPGADDDA